VRYPLLSRLMEGYNTGGDRAGFFSHREGGVARGRGPRAAGRPEKKEKFLSIREKADLQRDEKEEDAMELFKLDGGE